MYFLLRMGSNCNLEVINCQRNEYFTQFVVVRTVRHPTICIQTNKMRKILVIRLYFPLNALHVSDCVSPSSGATL